MSVSEAQAAEARPSLESVDESGVSRHVGLAEVGVGDSSLKFDGTAAQNDKNDEHSTPTKEEICVATDVPSTDHEHKSKSESATSSPPQSSTEGRGTEPDVNKSADSGVASSVDSTLQSPGKRESREEEEAKKLTGGTPQNPVPLAKSDLHNEIKSQCVKEPGSEETVLPEIPPPSETNSKPTASAEKSDANSKAGGIAMGGKLSELSSPSAESPINDESKAKTKEEVLPADKESVSREVTGETSADQQLEASKAGASSTDIDDEKQSIYHIKWIKHKGTTMPIITQNENGPCPLLAIMNLLLLQSKIKLPAGTEVVASNELMAHLADYIFEHVPKNINEDTRLNYEQNMHDAIAVFPKLQTGLDVNVRFTGVSEFEYTPECIVFDLLDIPLYHGWLVDPQMPGLVAAVGNRTYNQLVEKIILQKNSNKEDLVAEALLAEEFLNSWASQLTYHGLSELSATVKEAEMCVLFRNNHFSTLYKHKNELFVLVTDQGFLRESNVVWETLSNIEGDGHFVDAEFRTYRVAETATTSLPAPSFPVNSKEQIDHDYLVALSLEQEQSELQPGATWSDSATLSDHELALRLQEEENQSAEGAMRQSAQKQPKPGDALPVAPPGAAAAAASTASSGSSSSTASKDKKESICLVM